MSEIRVPRETTASQDDETLDKFLRKLAEIRSELTTVQDRVTQLKADESVLVRALRFIEVEISDSQDEIDAAALKKTVREKLRDFEGAVEPKATK